MEYRFDATEWKSLRREERARRCRLLAEQAMVLANLATDGSKERYMTIAKEWMKLASDIERAAN
jgi:hypothetical protein